MDASKVLQMVGRTLGRSFIAIAALGALFLAQGCGGDDPVIVEPDPIVIAQVSETTVGPGDTLVITGEGFSATAASNTVVFNNSLGTAAPFAATATRIDVIVPQNAAGGPMWIEAGGARSNSVEMGIVHGVGDVWTMGSANSSYTFKVPVQSGTERYLIIPHSASQQPASFSYQVSPAAAAQIPVAPAPARLAPAAGRICLHETFRRWMENVGERTHYRPDRPSQPAKRSSFQPGTEVFYVLNTLTPTTLPSGLPDPNDFTAVTAELKKTGRRCYIYADITMPAGGFTAADYDMFGDLFDNGIYQTDSTYFGAPTDIDENDRVIILFTPVVNDLTPDGTAQTQGYYAGFFGPNDLLPDLFPEGTTNGGEIFYSLVPDPFNEYGNAFSKQQVLDVVPPTLGHELEHMISTGFRLLNYGISYIQATWLEEGMAHMAEDLNGDNSGNEARISWYFPDPGAVPLMGDDTIQQRAAIYLFVRYIADQLGTQILRTMAQSSKVGTGTVEQVTGEQFFATFADWVATLYLSGRGITTDPRYEYTSIDLRDTFTFPHLLLVTERLLSQGAFSDIVAGAAADYYILRNPTAPGITVTVTANSAAHIRLVVTRIQ